MRTIYQSAVLTIVFLGPEDRFCARAISVIKRLAAVDPAAVDPESPIDGLNYFTSHPEDHEAFAHFLSRPWWSRVWVIQEVAVARAAIVVWGAESFDWEVCARAVHAARHYSDFVPLEQETFWASRNEQYRAHAVVWARLRFQQGREVRLFSLLKEFWDHEASDARDKIFGVLGLVVDENARIAKPDYMKSWERVYGDFAVNIAVREGNMDVLAICSGVGARRREALPTWTPDWTSESCRKSLIMMRLKEVRDTIGRDARRQMPDFCASGPNTVHYDIWNNSGVIKLVGMRIGIVSALSRIQDKSWSKEDLIKNWMPIAENIGEEYLNGESSEVAFAQTICPNQSDPDDEDLEELSRGWFVATMGRKFMLSDSGHMGLAPAETVEGDVICVVKGARTPLIMRTEDDHFLIVGEAYGEYFSSDYYFSSLANNMNVLVHGVMYSEAVEGCDDPGLPLREFEVW